MTSCTENPSRHLHRAGWWWFGIPRLGIIHR